MTCQIRPWRLEDAAQLAKILNNKKILDNLRDGLPYPYKESDAREYIQAMLDCDKNAVFPFAITFHSQVIGSIGAFRKDNIHFRTAELGYYIAEPFWGNGLGTSAVTQVSCRLFNTTDLLRIFAEPFACNVASCRVLEKSGFQCEGVLRSNAVKNRKILDMKLYSLVKS